MKILIEGYRYDEATVRECLADHVPFSDNNTTVMDVVGYYYNPATKDCVFILPKVILDDKDEAFGHVTPADMVDFDKAECLSNNERRFIYEFSVWIYRALVVYDRDNPKSTIMCRSNSGVSVSGQQQASGTFLDIILALLRFSRVNRDFLVFTIKVCHSGYNKIDWRHTVTRDTAYMKGGRPIYLKPTNKRKEVDFDEELLVIFFSVLSHIHREYGFPVSIPVGFPLIPPQQFSRYLGGYGRRRLRQIKYKYFSDKTRALWALCYAFFERAERISHRVGGEEYLLASSFDRVFEAMIDELIGDKNIEPGLKEQYDGKRVDHMYKWQGLIENNDRLMYYIGDSKYYKSGNVIGRESVYKQYTYARNVIQWNLNIFLDENQPNPDVTLRDDETEGYNVIPNFYISAEMSKALSYDEEMPHLHSGYKPYKSRQFENRLFDRDTLLISHYDVNFLYIVALYSQGNVLAKGTWREKVRNKFRSEIQTMLNENYEFYVMSAHPEISAKEYVAAHFKILIGKINRPFTDKALYSLALAKGAEENEALLTELRKHFFVVPCPLGQDPRAALNGA